VIGWAVAHRIGVLTVGDPRTVLDVAAGRRHNPTATAMAGRPAIAILTDKATLAGITVRLVDERGTSSTCPPAPDGSPDRGAGLCPADTAPRRTRRRRGVGFQSAVQDGLLDQQAVLAGGFGGRQHRPAALARARRGDSCRSWSVEHQESSARHAALV
jgi:hypothetical protein